MNFGEYFEQYKQNYEIMFPEKDGAAADEEAVKFLFDNRRTFFASEKEFEDFICKVAVLAGVDESPQGKPGWNRFIKKLLWLLKCLNFEPYEIAAICEFRIIAAGCFFGEGSIKMAMLMSMYIFMHCNQLAAVYKSRDEYLKYMKKTKDVSDDSNIPLIFVDDDMNAFLDYFRTLCSYNNLKVTKQLSEDNRILIKIDGFVDNLNCHIINDALSEIKDKKTAEIIFDCENMNSIMFSATSVFDKLKSEGAKFVIKNANYDASLALSLRGLNSSIENFRDLPQLTAKGCEVIGEGAQSVIYKLNDDMIVKVFRKTPDYDDVIRERIANKYALMAGIAAPFSLGFAWTDGKLSILMERINSDNLLEKLVTDSGNYDIYMDGYVALIKRLHSVRSRNILNLFPQDEYGRGLFVKAGVVDNYLEKPFRGKVRDILQSLDDEVSLIHGDIQPKNVMFFGDEMLLIDFDTVCTGMAIYDLSALCRTMVIETMFNFRPEFLPGLDEAATIRVFDDFFARYYKGEDPGFVKKKRAQCTIIGTVLALNKYIRKGRDSEMVKATVKFLEKSLAEYELLY